MLSGSKYGGYGTFLPTHARAPSLLAEPHPVPPAAEPVRTAEAPVEVMELPLPPFNCWFFDNGINRAKLPQNQEGADLEVCGGGSP